MHPLKWRSQNLQASTIEGCFQSRLRRYEPACGVTAFGTASVALRNVRVRHGETMNLEWLIATGAYTGGAAAPKSRVQPDFTPGHIDQENGEVEPALPSRSIDAVLRTLRTYSYDASAQQESLRELHRQKILSRATPAIVQSRCQFEDHEKIRIYPVV